MEEVLEIAKTGLKFNLIHTFKGIHSTWRFNAGSDWGVQLQPLCVTPDGHIVREITSIAAFQPVGCLDGTIGIYLVSDANGFWARACPCCNGYFRIDRLHPWMHCVYCGVKLRNYRFMTSNQKKFIRLLCEAYNQASESGENIIVDIDQIVASLDCNADERQLMPSKCPVCDLNMEIMADYRLCPKCGKPNAKEVIKQKFDRLMQKVDASKKISDQAERDEQKIAILNTCVADFDGFCRYITKALMTIPSTDKRRRQLLHLSFQNPIETFQALEQWYGFNVFENLSDEKKSLMTRMFNIRHVYAHNNGCVDRRFLQHVPHESAQMGQKLRIKSSNLTTLLQITTDLCCNYLKAFYSVWADYRKKMDDELGYRELGE